MKRCERCHEYYTDLLTECKPERKQSCPCRGANDNCFKCQGLGAYRATYTQHTPEENQ